MELETDDLGDQHRYRLAKHCRLSLNATYTPTQNSKSIDHRCVTVGAYQRVGIGNFTIAVLGRPNDLGQMFKIDLVANAGAGRYAAEVVECLRAPTQKGIAFAIAFIFKLDITGEGIAATKRIDLNGMIDHQIYRRQWIDFGRVAAEFEASPAASRPDRRPLEPP